MMEEWCSAGTPAEHLLIWHIDTQSLARRGISCSDELYRLLSSHGRVASLEVYLHLSAAAVSFTRTQDAQKVRHLLKGVPSLQRIRHVAMLWCSAAYPSNNQTPCSAFSM